MNTVRRLQNFYVPWVAAILLVCVSEAGAQGSYKIEDLGTGGNVNLGCAMSLNSEGWTEIMAQNVGGDVDSLFGTLLSGRALIDVKGYKLDLGSLGGPNTSMMWGQINNSGQIVGFSETNIPDPNGEDVCGFGTHLECLPFLWQSLHMSALPTLGGNNGQASSINSRGEVAGFAETAAVDPGCPPNLTRRPVLWKSGTPDPLPTLPYEPDGVAYALNDQGQAAGSSGNCSSSVLHAVSWQDNNVTQLADFGTGAVAYNMNNQGQIVGTLGTANNLTQTGALWQNGEVTAFDLLPGDFGGIASGVNSKGQAVGSNWDSNFSWSHGYIWQNNVTTDLNTLIPASSNLYITMANQINDRGQISGMAIVLSGPDAGNIHAFLATPVKQSLGKSVADMVTSRPKSKVTANFSKQRLPGLKLGRLQP